MNIQRLENGQNMLTFSQDELASWHENNGRIFACYFLQPGQSGWNQSNGAQFALRQDQDRVAFGNTTKVCRAPAVIPC